MLLVLRVRSVLRCRAACCVSLQCRVLADGADLGGSPRSHREDIGFPMDTTNPQILTLRTPFSMPRKSGVYGPGGPILRPVRGQFDFYINSWTGVFTNPVGGAAGAAVHYS